MSNVYEKALARIQSLEETTKRQKADLETTRKRLRQVEAERDDARKAQESADSRLWALHIDIEELAALSKKIQNGEYRDS